MDLAVLRPILTALILPPLLPLLVAALGLLLAVASRHRRKGLALVALALLSLWLLSCYAVASWLSMNLLVKHPVLLPAEIKARGAQAIVVLGGGILRNAPEYQDAAQPNAYTTPRITYGVHLARATGLPLAFTGGVGHAAPDGTEPEGVAIARYSQDLLGTPIRWVDNRARDTMENGLYMAAMLKRDGIGRVALVTHGFHMERSVYAFERAGLDVIPAPTALLLPVETTLIEWMPSATGLNWSRLVLREWLGLLVARRT